MKRNLAAAFVMGLVLVSVTAVAQSTNGTSGGGPQGGKVQQQSQDQKVAGSSPAGRAI